MDSPELLRYSEQSDKNAAARIQTRLIQLSWVVLSIVLAAEIYWGNYFAAAVTAIGGSLLIIPYLFIKRGNLTLSGLIIVLFILGTITTLATNGKGIHDISMMAFPVVIIFTSLALDWAGVRRGVFLTLLCIAWLVFGEAGGLFQSQPIDKPDWVDFIIICSILIILSLVINVLVRNMRQNLEMAKLEIAQRKMAEAELREKEVQFHNLADSGLALIWTAGTDKLCNYFNKPWLEFTGRTLEQEMGNGWVEGVYPDDVDRCFQTYVSAFDKREHFEMEYRLRHVSGEYRWIQDMGTPSFNSNQEFTGYIGHCFDITERKQIEEALRARTEELDSYFSTSLDLFCIADTDGFFRRLNPQWEETLGYSLNELEGRKFFDFVHPDDIPSTIETLASLTSQKSIRNFVNRYRCKDGSYRWIEWRSVPAGNVIYAAARDITEHKQAEDQLRYQGTHDILTGIYNRLYFEEELSRIEHGRDFPVSIIIGDVDGLKMVNDTRGHMAGDQLLIQTAAILKSVFRSEDVLARIGGDEFAVIMPNTDDSSVERKIESIREKLLVNNAESSNIQVNISLGAATTEKGDLIRIFKLADQRMYLDKAKHVAGSNQIPVI